MQPPEIDLGKLDAIIEKHKGEKWGLIPLLQDVQETYGYVPPETIEPIAAALNVFPSQVQGVITFYAGFSLKPPISGPRLKPQGARKKCCLLLFCAKCFKPLPKSEIHNPKFAFRNSKSSSVLRPPCSDF